MIDRNTMQGAFSVLHASPDTLEKVQAAVSGQKKRRHILPKGLLIAAVLALSLTVAGAAGVASLVDARVSHAGEVSDGTLHAFSAGSIETDSMEMYDVQNDPIELPTMERVLTDKDMVQQLVGDALCRIEATIQAEGCTITLENMLIDENGAGVLTYTLENPDGINYAENGYGMVTTPLMPDLRIGGATNAQYMDTAVYLDKEQSTDTCLHLVLYFCNFGEWQMGDDLYFTINSGTDGRETHAVRITPQRFVPERTFLTEEGYLLRLSPLSAYWDNPCPGQQQYCSTMAIGFYGNGFTVTSDDEKAMNYVVSCAVSYDADGNRAPDGADIGLAYVFDRLVDVEQVQYVFVSGYCRDAKGNATWFDDTYWPIAPEKPDAAQ